MSTVVAVFEDRGQAEEAIHALKDQGFEDSEISIVAKNEGGEGDMGGTENIADGTAWGGALGGVAGLLAGAGALAIPGIGPIIAAGPIAAALTGAVTGGIAGGLIDLGIPEERGQYYEGRVREGKILAVVETEEDPQEAADLLEETGGDDVEVHEE